MQPASVPQNTLSGLAGMNHSHIGRTAQPPSCGTGTLQERRNSPVQLSFRLPGAVLNDEDTAPEMSGDEINRLFQGTARSIHAACTTEAPAGSTLRCARV